MSITIRISKLLYEEAKKAAVSELRTIPRQIEYWAFAGKEAIAKTGEHQGDKEESD